ncbi:MAG: LLM class flavin-dependent oxidoreductase [Gammaproteobacteria bacterium]|nr:LLM class flavin-dependent oxidoreductase [Gammaproteobacteria bacterium]
MAVSLPLNQVLQDTIDLVHWAEENGYTDGWFADPGAPDGMTTAALIAAHTKKLRIGMAIVPVYTRSPTVLAASTDVIAQALPGRFILGLGSSSEIIMQNFNGIKLEKPLTRVKETAIVVRSMLNGEKTSFTDLQTVYSRGYSQRPTEPPVPIYLAGLRPKMLEMAAQYGDGVILNLWPKSALPKMLEHIRIGAERAGKQIEDLEIVNRYAVIVTDDKTEGYDRFRQHFIPYFSNPVYNNFLKWCGYEHEANEILEGWAARDRNRTAAAFHDELVDQIGVVGSAEECRERIQTHARQGITTSIIAPPSRELDQSYETLEAFTAKNFQFD